MHTYVHAYIQTYISSDVGMEGINNRNVLSTETVMGFTGFNHVSRLTEAMTTATTAEAS